VRGDAESPNVNKSLQDVASEALKLMSARLLN